MNWLKKIWIFTKRQSEQVRETSTFISREIKKENYLKDKIDNYKVRLLHLIAPILNHPSYNEGKKIIINLLFTGGVIGMVIWMIQTSNPLLQGFSIAVTIKLVQYYMKWYFTIKK